VTPAVNQLSLSPLGAGDLIDRTVRLYRRHFTTLIRAAAPPVVISALGSVLWEVSKHGLSLTESGGMLALYIVSLIVGGVLIVTGSFFFLLVMGGASRNLVLHLLWGEPVAARSIYRSVRARFWGLVGALVLILLLAMVVALPVMFVWAMVVALAVGGALAVFGNSTFGVVVAVILFAAIAVGALFVYFFVMGRVAYVPQVMLVEGRSVGEAFSRSIQLARGNVRRLTAMFLFTSFATYAVVLLLAVPLGWYGYLRGVNPMQLSGADAPLWYVIGWQVLAQTSSILLAPVWMLGLSLLYVDERVRHEGYDIELLARQQLGEMPDLPDGGAAPLARAIHDAHAPGGDVSYVPRFQPRTLPQQPRPLSSIESPLGLSTPDATPQTSIHAPTHDAPHEIATDETAAQLSALINHENATVDQENTALDQVNATLDQESANIEQSHESLSEAQPRESHESNNVPESFINLEERRDR
jgi:hypothetical protein